jgi:hypothetical protein
MALKRSGFATLGKRQGKRHKGVMAWELACKGERSSERVLEEHKTKHPHDKELYKQKCRKKAN